MRNEQDLKQSPKVQETNSIVKIIEELFGVCMECLSITQSKLKHGYASALYYITASEIHSNQDEVDDKVNTFPSHKILKAHYSEGLK